MIINRRSTMNDMSRALSLVKPRPRFRGALWNFVWRHGLPGRDSLWTIFPFTVMFLDRDIRALVGR
jgi:hypothetical protein